MTFHAFFPGADQSRRRFVQGLALGGLAAGTGIWRPQALAAGRPAEAIGTSVSAQCLRIGRAPVNITGHPRNAITVNQQLPAPLLRWREGDSVELDVINTLADQFTSIHWHGLLVPANMDGVPGMSFDGIAPGQRYRYRFTLRQSGTYWYHSHSLFQEQAGLYGPIIVDPLTPPPYHYDREHVILLSDWTDLEPAALFRRLKQMPSYDNVYQRTVGDFLRDAQTHGLRATLADRGHWGRMRMTPTDLSDVNARTYTYLLNGTAPAGNWTGLFQPGETLLLRFINGASMTYFDVRIPGLKLTVVSADGQYIHPVSVDELRIAAGETFDVLVQPRGQDAFTVFAQDMGRTGYARGTLAVRAGLQAPVPANDRRPQLMLSDMGHAMQPMAIGNPHAGMPGHGDHAASTDAARLADPGIGLRDNGRRVLAYADLHSLFEDPDGRAPNREMTLRLTGNMEKFAWSFDGVAFAAAEPLRLRYGERLRVVLINDTMMQHPIHLHGMWSDLEDAQGQFQVRKHTIDMPPGTRRSYRVRADALGRWAYHCHLLYHMEAGMMREVRVDP